MSQGWNPTNTVVMISYVGAGVIRDGIPPASNVAWSTAYEQLYNMGVRLNTLIGGAANKSLLANQIAKFVDYQTRRPGLMR